MENEGGDPVVATPGSFASWRMLSSVARGRIILAAFVAGGLLLRDAYLLLATVGLWLLLESDEAWVPARPLA